MLNIFASVAVLAGLSVGADVAPTVTQVNPSPVPLGTTVEVLGSDFQVDQTTVTIGGVSQQVLFVDAAKAIIDVDPITPLGVQPLVVATPFGQSPALDIEVVAAPPQIASVLPGPLVLGGLATVIGDWLDTVETVTLSGIELETTEIAPTVVVATLPLDAALLGDHLLEVSGSAGSDVVDVTVAAPLPAVDTLAPNPARKGDLVTIKGVIIPVNVAARIGGVTAIVTSSANGQVTAQVPPSLEPGPHQVEVAVGAQWSPGVGPLHVQAADAARPEVTAVYPLSVAAGGVVWVVGENLDRATWLEGDDDFTLGTCNDRGCMIDVAATAELGPRTFAVGGDEGTSVVQLTVSSSDLVTPVLTGADPKPAFRGQSLTLAGTDLFDVSAVVVGGVEQAIEFVAEDGVRVTLAADTPMGAEPAFVSGVSGSAPLIITVLDPLPEEPEPEPEPEVEAAPESGPADSGAEVAEGPAPDDGGGEGGGCAGGSSPAAPWVTLLIALALVARRRQTAG